MENTFMEQFEPVDWSYDTNIYEVNLRQYTTEGSFAAFEKELPRLKDMGVEVIWFMPVTPISVAGRLGSLGSYYACSNYTATNPEFGSLEDFKKLVRAAHALDLKVIIDWVANHTGQDHVWTKQFPEFYRRNSEGNFFDAHGWADVIDLNYDNPELQTEMISSMRFWIENCDIDGFRCDMAMLVPLSFWKRARTELDRMKKLFWLAECEEIDYHQVFDATYCWKFLHKMEAFWRWETDLNGIKDVLHYYSSSFPANAFHLYFTTNHDENSHSGSEYERLGDAVLPFAVFCCTWNGVPLIYSGQELPNKKRLKFFDKDFIEWNGNYALHDFYKLLLSLRKRHPALQAGNRSETIVLPTDAEGFVLTFLRKKGADEVLVVLNLSREDKHAFRITDEKLTGGFTNVFTGENVDFSGEKLLSLRSWDFLLFVKG